MKRFFIAVLIIAISIEGQAQSSAINSLSDSVNKAQTDTDRAKFLYFLSYYYQNYRPDSALILAQSAKELSDKWHFLRGQIGSRGQIALAFNRLGSYDKALQNYIEQLELIETQNDPYNLASAYLNIALVYNSQKDLAKALYYARKADSIALTIADKEPSAYLYTTLDIGDIYSNNNQLDSALFYTRLCYNESLKQKDSLINHHKKDIFLSISGTALNNLGNISFKAANYDSALHYFRRSVPNLDSVRDYQTLSECYYGMAQSFEKTNLPDSALLYAERSFYLATENKFLKHAMNASFLMSNLYKRQNNIDSAFAFQQTYILLKDSFENAEKIKQLQNLTITEEQRQLDKAHDLVQQNKDRRLKLELLLVGISIPILFIITAFISGRRVHKRIIKFSGVFSLLFVFEYITIFIHPWVMEKTGHSPVYEIFIFVAIAAIISPLHHRIENWLITKLNFRHQNRINKALAAKAAAEAEAIETEKAAAETKAIAAAIIQSEDPRKMPSNN
jgi:tetratricopeptide (TPR) repeat protein